MIILKRSILWFSFYVITVSFIKVYLQLTSLVKKINSLIFVVLHYDNENPRSFSDLGLNLK